MLVAVVVVERSHAMHLPNWRQRTLCGWTLTPEPLRHFQAFFLFWHQCVRVIVPDVGRLPVPSKRSKGKRGTNINVGELQ